MRNKKFLLGMAVVLCVSALAGCGEGNRENDYTSLKKVPITEDVDNSNNTGDNDASIPEDASDGNDANSLIFNSDVQGHVVEFSDTGCTVSPTEEEQVDGGKLVVGAQPGYEEEEKNVNVHYATDCQFQIAKIDIATNKADISDAGISDIKKQTNLLIYGEWSDTHNIEATKVIIYSYEFE